MRLEMPRVFVTRVDMAAQDARDIYNPDFLEEMESIGFSMTGGLYVGLEMEAEGEPVAFDYVQVARRVAPVEGEPENMAESFEPAFMYFMALRIPAQGSRNWGADFVNAIIAANGGTVPDAWIAAAFDGLPPAARAQ